MKTTNRNDPHLRAAPSDIGGHAYWFLAVKENHHRVKWDFLCCSTHPRDWHQVLPGNFETLEGSKRKTCTTINQQNCIARIQLKPQLVKKKKKKDPKGFTPLNHCRDPSAILWVVLPASVCWITTRFLLFYKINYDLFQIYTITFPFQMTFKVCQLVTSSLHAPVKCHKFALPICHKVPPFPLTLKQFLGRGAFLGCPHVQTAYD